MLMGEMRRVRFFFFLSANERSKGDGKGKEEEEKGEREFGSDALKSTCKFLEKQANFLH